MQINADIQPRIYMLMGVEAGHIKPHPEAFV